MTHTTTSHGSDGGAGWLIATILIVAVLVGVVVLYQNGTFTTSNEGANVNVSVPGAAVGGEN